MLTNRKLYLKYSMIDFEKLNQHQNYLFYLQMNRLMMKLGKLKIIN